MRYLAAFILAVALVAVAFHFAKPLPGNNFDESFLPKASTVRYIAAGNDASVAGLFWIKGLTELGESYLTGKEYGYLGHVANLSTSLDTLFYTPYYFVGGVVPIGAPDTSDFVVLRRGHKVFPDDWKLALYFALRLAKGPYPNKSEAANVMRPYFDSPDTTIPNHIRTIHRTFELDTMQTEIALEAVISDVLNPRFKKFRSSFYHKTYRLLGYRDMLTKDNSEAKNVYSKIEAIINAMADGKIHPAVAYRELLSMKKEEQPAPATENANAIAADSTATSAVTDSTATEQPAENGTDATQPTTTKQ
ncbi:MAG: hypothetical protein MJY47_08600 [Fibrobacter sp.]|nr:hypothetical protein [Fibrobacter sp.]